MILIPFCPFGPLLLGYKNPLEIANLEGVLLFYPWAVMRSRRP